MAKFPPAPELFGFDPGWWPASERGVRSRVCAHRKERPCWLGVVGGQFSWGRNPRNEQRLSSMEGIIGGGKDEEDGTQVGPKGTRAGNQGGLKGRAPGLLEAGL